MLRPPPLRRQAGCPRAPGCAPRRRRERERGGCAAAAERAHVLQLAAGAPALQRLFSSRLSAHAQLQDLSGPPPFGLADIRAAIPDHCWERNAWKSAGYLVRDVALVFAFAAGAYALNTW